MQRVYVTSTQVVETSIFVSRIVVKQPKLTITRPIKNPKQSGQFADEKMTRKRCFVVHNPEKLLLSMLGRPNDDKQKKPLDY